ncbi:MAG: pirin family protein [Acidimicrobiales bacterium]|nr:pirin family protein [Acidimicrobiales bacterium]
MNSDKPVGGAISTSGSIDLRRAQDRFHTKTHWLDSWHSFSFNGHYDPANVNHGLLVVNNDDVIAPGTGFPLHPHRDMEIVTWVLDGQLEHRDSTGAEGVIYPGLAQRMSAGTGVRHSEMNASQDTPVHLIQMWVLPDTAGVTPSYQQVDVSEDLAGGGLVRIADGVGDAALHIHQRGAVLLAGRLPPSASAEVPDAPHVHVFIARGNAALGDARLEAGDAARLTRAGSLPFTAGPDGVEVLIWATD